MWQRMLDIFIGIICSGTIIIGVIRFSVDQIAQRLNQKYQADLQKENDQHRLHIENKNYVSKVRFDAEFQIYRELTSCFFEMVKCVGIMIPMYAEIPSNEKVREEVKERHYQDALQATIAAQDALNGNAPFISQENFEGYDHILLLCRQQLSAFNKRWLKDYIATDRTELEVEDYLRTKEITEYFKSHNEKIRAYLASLEVI